jgi:hypothetical protein
VRASTLAQSVLEMFNSFFCSSHSNFTTLFYH